MASSLIGHSLGKYKIVQLLGQGGMATVYRGYQEDIDRYVAIKVLPPHPGRDHQFTERFRMEARTVARLQHPHIVPLYDYDAQDDILYLVMALVQGGSLTDRIRRGALSLTEIERMLNQIAPALDYAHRNGVIHRDIKPDNILIDGDGNAFLSDFGIAKLVMEEGSMTMTGSLIGTPAYMSPEQGQGLPVTPRSDIYALGVVVFEMLTGRQPYTADTPMQVVLQHMNAPLPSLIDSADSVPVVLDAVMRRVLAKQPDSRYQTAARFADDFSRAVRGQSTDAETQVSVNQDDQPTAVYGAPARPSLTAAGQRTTEVPITAPAHINLLLIGAGLAIIVLLVAAVLVLALRENTPAPAPTVDTAQQSTTSPTNAPQVVRQPERPTFGSLRFSTVDQLGDTVALQAVNITPPADGEQYAAWLATHDADAVLPLGTLRVDGVGSGVLTYTDTDGLTLPAVYSRLLITREETIGDAPEGEVVYSASVPSEVASALDAILIASDEGIDGGSLFNSLMSEAEIGRQHTGLSAASENTGALYTHAEHTINILLGTMDDWNGNGQPQNPGHGEGVAHFLDLIERDLTAAANSPTASTALQSQVELIRVCTQNARARMEAIVAIEHTLLAVTDMAQVGDATTQSTELARQMIEGHDLNGNGQIEPFEGECGIEQIPTFGVLVGNMEIVAGD